MLEGLRELRRVSEAWQGSHLPRAGPGQAVLPSTGPAASRPRRRTPGKDAGGARLLGGLRQGRGAILVGGAGAPALPVSASAPQVPGSGVRRSAQTRVRRRRARLPSAPSHTERGSPGRVLLPSPLPPLLSSCLQSSGHPRPSSPALLARAPAPPLSADPFPPSWLARAAPLLTPPRGSSPPPPPPHSRLETVGTDAPASRPAPPSPRRAAEPTSPSRQPGPLLPPPAAQGRAPLPTDSSLARPPGPAPPVGTTKPMGRRVPVCPAPLGQRLRKKNARGKVCIVSIVPWLKAARSLLQEVHGN
ncbi:vegetative cell wall protein gp1-like [Calypte anna]|uniref:vegetative cell wall protein gp1-like n=1 Tax=Calypte anna TaxID=9244 RepID=UPI0011C37DA3|nr:vegetative cell wall protein gp1-like [Calypte anna]